MNALEDQAGEQGIDVVSLSAAQVESVRALAWRLLARPVDAVSWEQMSDVCSESGFELCIALPYSCSFTRRYSIPRSPLTRLQLPQSNCRFSIWSVPPLLRAIM